MNNFGNLYPILHKTKKTTTTLLHMQNHATPIVTAAASATATDAAKEPTFILKFLTLPQGLSLGPNQDSDQKKMSTTRRMSSSTLNDIPFFKLQLEGGALFKDSLKPEQAGRPESTFVNVVDLTIYNIHLEDLIVYFKVKKTLKKGLALTKEVFRPLEIKPVRPTNLGLEVAAASSTSVSGMRKEEERLKAKEQEWQDELTKARLNPRFNLQTFFKLCDVFIDHDVIKMASKFASEYEDMGVLGEDLLSEIAEDYLKSVFTPPSYNAGLRAVSNSCYKIEAEWNSYLKFLNAEPEATNDEVDARYAKTLVQVHECSENSIRQIDHLIKVIKAQADNYKLTHDSNASISSYQSHGSRYIQCIALGDFLGRIRFDLNRLPAYTKPQFFSSPEAQRHGERVSDLIDRYINYLSSAQKKISNLKFLIPQMSFRGFQAYSDDDLDFASGRWQSAAGHLIDTQIYTVMTMLNDINAVFGYLHGVLDSARFFSDCNIFDAQMHFTQRVSLFVLQSPAIAKMIWETVELRKLLVFGYMKVSNTKSKRYIQAAFEELIPLTEGRIDFAKTVDSDVSKALWSDPELARLYKKYNSWEYRFSLQTVQAEHGQDVDVVWKQIQDRTKQLIDKVQKDKQKNAPRGPMRPGWYM